MYHQGRIQWKFEGHQIMLMEKRAESKQLKTLDESELLRPSSSREDHEQDNSVERTELPVALFGPLLALFMLFAPGTAHAGLLDWFFPPEEKPPELAVASTTTANLADPITLNSISSKFVRISPGTRLLLMERIDKDTGKRLALSVDGVWVYVEPDEFRVIKADHAAAGADNIIMRQSVAVPLTADGLQVILQEGAVLPLHEENTLTGPFLVKIDNTVFDELRPDKNYKVKVDRTRAAAVDPGVTSAAQVDFFTRGFAGKIYGQFKGCDDLRLVEAEYGASIATRLEAKAVYVDLAVSADLSQRVKETTLMEPNEIVAIRYYRRSGTGGEYIWKEIESCGDEATGEIESRIRVPGPQEIIIKGQLLQNRGIAVDPATKRPYISCNEQYDALHNYMAEKMEEADIRFFIGLIARWKNHGDMDTCTDPS